MNVLLVYLCFQGFISCVVSFVNQHFRQLAIQWQLAIYSGFFSHFQLFSPAWCHLFFHML
jgi:hypothetical protein